MTSPVKAGTRRLQATTAAGLALLAMFSVARGQSPIVLSDVTSQTGITFQHTDGGSGRRYIVEYVSAGLALLDYNGDGRIDVYFLNGAPLPGSRSDTPPPRNVLYRNDGDWKFTDVTEQAGLGDTGYGLGVAAADYDNDGDQDLYVNNFGPNVLYRNNGDGTFADVTDAAGVQCGNRVGAGVCFLDVDQDADLDLYVSNYVVFSYDKHVQRTVLGVPVYPSPQDYQPDADALYRNNGDGTFTDASIPSGIGLHRGPGMGVVAGDYDNDGDTDIFVANDVKANFLFQNDGSGHFEEVGLLAGIAYDFSGIRQGSMGVVSADYNHDGWLDFFVTSYQGELPVLYRNSGQGFFEDVTLQTGAGSSTAAQVTWGTGLIDFDNDTHPDLFIACGHVMDNIALQDDTQRYATRNILLANTGKGNFKDVSSISGDGLRVEAVSRGAGFGDLDNDGDVDVVILNSRAKPTILRNDSPPDNHWIQLRLEGTDTNRDGVGARVTVVAGGLTMIDEVHSGCGYQSHYGMRLYFGLGPHDHVDRIEVRWIGGGLDTFEQVDADRLVILKEGSGRWEK